MVATVEDGRLVALGRRERACLRTTRRAFRSFRARSPTATVRRLHAFRGVSRCRHLRKWFLSIGLGGLPRPRLNVVRQAGLVSRLRATEFTEDGRGLLMVSGEVAVVPQARVELGPNPVLRAVWLGRRG